MNRTKPISGELLQLKEQICGVATDYGLDFYEVIFEVCDYDTINILASLGGFPHRYPHWRFGMDYDQMYKGYAYGLQKIYEMVINTAPCYAYLLNTNNMVDQKTVMAHVYGHADFFKNNLWFANTDRNMMDVMANHGTKIRRYMEKYGQDSVEEFIDKVLSLDNLLDPNLLFVDHKENIEDTYRSQEKEHVEVSSPTKALESFMRSRARKNAEDKEVETSQESFDFEGLPTRDIMGFLLQNAPIEDWQSDIIGILREEAYYFLPQRMTKIMNEGWASYWHSTIMTKHALKASEIIDFADHHAGVMAMSRKNINPYKIGIELFRDIEYRWNTGRFGKEYNECTNIREKENWNLETNQGREKMFEVRKSHNDVTFIDDFFTQEFCERQQLFTYKYNHRMGRFVIDTRDFEAIKEKLLTGLTNFGTPVISVENGNFHNRGELLLRHHYQGVDIDLQYAAETMKNIFVIWKRPVNLSTISDGRETIFVYDGEQFKPLS